MSASPIMAIHRECFLCRGCGTRKPITDFYRRTGKPDKPRYPCKACQRAAASRRHYANHPGHSPDDPPWKKYPPGTDIIAIRRTSARKYQKEHRAEYRAYLTKWHRKHPKARIAYQRIVNEKRKGNLSTPSTCSCCGCASTIHGHHPDYAKPLRVIWLCVGCHRRLHQRQSRRGRPRKEAPDA